MYQILSGMRVVECASFIAAPSCALHLLQLGADVLRIDPIGGGPDFHRWPVSDRGHSYYWEGLNKGKKSIALDLSRPEGRSLAVDIIAASGPQGGLFVTNFPKDGFFSHEALRVRRPDLITVRIMGWNDGAQALDYTINAAIGLPYMTGSAKNGDEPVNHVLPAWDLLTGSYAAFALLAAERHRRDTGHGQEVTVPLSDVALASVGHMGQIAEVLTGEDRPRQGNDLFGAFGRDFTTADGHRVMVVAITARQWSGLVKALQLGAAISTLEASLETSFERDEGMRFRYRDALFPLFEGELARRTLAEVEEIFNANAVCWAPYRTLRRALQEEPRFSTDQELFTAIEHPSGDRYPAPGAMAKFHAVARTPVTRAPHLGEHTDEVLDGVLGLSPTQIGKLHDAGIIAGPEQR